jgi:hypothetical protein
MAFIKKKVQTFKWPVKVEEPSDGGVFDTSEFVAIFKRLPRSKFEKLADRGEHDMLQAILVGWEDVLDENNKAIPFSQAALKEFTDDAYWIRGVLAAYTETIEGAKLGN